MSVMAASSSADTHPFRLASFTKVTHRREPDIDGRRHQIFHRGQVFHEERPGKRPAAAKGEQQVERLPIASPGEGLGDGIQDHLPQLALGGH